MAEVHRDASAWCETAVELTGFRSAVFDALGQTQANGLLPERATRVQDMDYVWKLGRTAPLLTCGDTQPAPTPATVG